MKHMFGALYKHPCPGCGSKTTWKEDGEIKTKIHGKKNRPIEIKGYYELFGGCSNPFCEWSKVGGIRDNGWSD